MAAPSLAANDVARVGFDAHFTALIRACCTCREIASTTP
jgi:hypothetical protein